MVTGLNRKIIGKKPGDKKVEKLTFNTIQNHSVFILWEAD